MRQHTGGEEERGGRGAAFLLACAVTLLMSWLLIAPSALAESWYPLGAGAAPVNHDPNADAARPTLAAMNATPYLSWQELDAPSAGGTAVGQVRAAMLAQDPLEPRPWQELLSPGAFSINRVPSHAAREPKLAIIGGVPFLAWIENDGSEDQVRVDSWNGSAWQPVGPTSYVNTYGRAGDVTIAGIGGVPYVAWTEPCCDGSGPAYNLYVKRYDSSTATWVPVGDNYLDAAAGASTHDPQLADVAGVPYATWTEDQSSSQAIHVASLDTVRNHWNQLGGTISLGASHPSITAIGSEVYVAYSAHDGVAGSDHVYVNHYNRTNSRWESIPYIDGDPYVNHEANGHAFAPSLTTIAGRLWLAWVEQPSAGGARLLRVADEHGTTAGSWAEHASPVNSGNPHDAGDPSILGVNGIPTVAWSEPDSTGHVQIHASALGNAPANTARPVLSGTPQVGNQLSCTHGSWTGSPTTFYVLWERGLHNATSDDDPSWHVIGGASGDTYTVQQADAGSRVRCRVVAENGLAAGEALSTSLRTDLGAPYEDFPGYPRVTGDAVAQGDALVGTTLTCDVGPLASDPSLKGWHNNPDFVYVWTRDGYAIPGATGPTYVPTRSRDPGSAQITNPAGDGDHLIGCGVGGRNDVGVSRTYSSENVHAVDGGPVNVALPSITVVPDNPAHPDVLHETLVCNPGSYVEDDGNHRISFAREGAAIPGANTSRYRVTAADLGRHLRCSVGYGNPFGGGVSLSNTILIPLPTGLDDVVWNRDGGYNQVDATNLLPTTERYYQALDHLTLRKLRQGVERETQYCEGVRSQLERQGTWVNRLPSRGFYLTPVQRCQVLLLDPEKVTPFLHGGGVRWTARCPGPPAGRQRPPHGVTRPGGPKNLFAGDTFGDAYLKGLAFIDAGGDPQDCPSLNIQVEPSDPAQPAPLSESDLQALAPATPTTIIWGLDHSHPTVAQAICPGSAPVLRSIFQYDREWDPHVVIIDGDGTVHSGHLDFRLGQQQLIRWGRLRPSQVRACDTSMITPPSNRPDLPCVTAAEMGPIHISNANLCPIDARSIDPQDFSQLLSGDLQAYLLAAADRQLGGTATHARDVGGGGGEGPASPRWVGWGGGTQTAGDVRLHPRRAGDFTLTGAYAKLAKQVIASTAENTVASNIAVGSPSSSPALDLNNIRSQLTSHLPPGTVIAHFNGLDFLYDPAKAALAYDQIYVARGIGGRSRGAGDLSGDPSSVIPGVSGDTGSLMVNGVDLNAVPKDGKATAALLVPGDVKGALPGVHSMTLTGRNLASSMGVPTDPQAVALGLAKPYVQTLKDDVRARASQALQDSNIDEMLNQYRNDATAQGKALYERVLKSLNLGPFKFAGDTHVDINSDGSATLTVAATLPGLTGIDEKTGKPGGDLKARAVIHADLQGHLALRGIRLEAKQAFLFGIDLRDVVLDYNSNTGFHVQAKILLPEAGNQGIDIKAFDLGPHGEFLRLAVDYLAGVGQGIPLGYGIFITTLGFDLNLAQESFGAHVVVSVGTSTGAGCPSLGADGTMTVKLSDPGAVHANVDLKVSCLQFGNVKFDAYQNGDISLTGHWGFDQGPIYFNVNLGAHFGPASGPPPDNWANASPRPSPSQSPGDYHFQIYGEGDGGVRHVLSGQIEAVLSDLGLAGCGSIDLGSIPFVGDVRVAGGASLSFRDGPPVNLIQIIKNLTLFTGCDIGGYYPLGRPTVFPNAAREAAASQPATFRVGPAHRPLLVSLEGTNRAPRVILRSPSGRVLDFSHADGNTGLRIPGRAWGTILDSENRTVVILARPEAGIWSVALAPGSAPIVRLRGAGILPAPKVRVRVSGRGSRRTLHYGIAPLRGQIVQLAELAKGSMVALRTVKGGGRGVIHYTVGEALAPQREIVAEVSQNGVPRRHLVVARYSAPDPRVGRVRHLRVRRVGSRALISWRRAALANRYLVQVDYGTGERALLRVRRGATRVFTGRVMRGEGLRVVVVALSPAGRRGPVAHRRLKGTMLVGHSFKLQPFAKWCRKHPRRCRLPHRRKPAKRRPSQRRHAGLSVGTIAASQLELVGAAVGPVPAVR